jgi:hypothetical protein
MSKSKLEILLDVVLGYTYVHKNIADAYQAYMEERKTLPQAGQEIEVSDTGKWVGRFRKFIGFDSKGGVVVECENGSPYPYNHYRIPTPNKKWKVVKDSYGFRLIFPEDHPTDLPTITTFED